MPIFKALASITAWIFFVGGCIAFLFTLIAWIATKNFTEINPAIAMSFLVVAVWLVAGVVVMRLRQKME